MKIVAIADTDAAKVAEVAECYQVPQEYCFHSAEELLAQDKLADVMFITTQDRQHVGHAIPALKKVMTCFWKNPYHRIWRNVARW